MQLQAVNKDSVWYNLSVVKTPGCQIMKLIDRSGERYERLTVQSRAPKASNPKDTNARWNCLCDCGKSVVAYGNDLKRGKVKSCGCLNDERIAQQGHFNATHGMTNKPPYRTWSGMISRCTSKGSQQWRYYGGRGIKVCERWRKFENFFSDMGIPPVGMTLDRIDPNGDYCPENCRWATPFQQSRNRRNSRMLTHKGMTLTVTEWARALGISTSAMVGRIANQFPPEKLFATALK